MRKSVSAGIHKELILFSQSCKQKHSAERLPSKRGRVADDTDSSASSVPSKSSARTLSNIIDENDGIDEENLAAGAVAFDDANATAEALAAGAAGDAKAAEAKAAAVAGAAKTNQSRLMTSGTRGDNTTTPKNPAGTSSIEQFHGATLSCDNDLCLATLEALSNHVLDHVALQSTEYEICRMLSNRCIALFNFYHNPGFMKLLAEAKAALAAYGGKQDPMLPKALELQLRKYGFVLTPRMWTRLELACIMVLLLDPNLCYLNINQKRGNEHFQNR